MLGVKLDPRSFLARVGEELGRIDPAQVKALADAIYDCYERRRFVFLCGNGGSGSNASHLCEDLGKGTLTRADFDNDKKKRLRVLSLTDNTPYILAWGNDEGFERVFVEQLKNLASPGDLLVAISGSGNSPNVLAAVEWANRHDLVTFGCTGFSGGKLRTLARHNLHVPLDDMGIVESIHLTAFHWVVDNLHARIGLGMHEPTEVFMANNRVVHFEIPANQPEKLVKFYSDLFGWKIDKAPVPGLDYWTCDTGAGPGINGGIMKRAVPQQCLTNYVTVEHLDNYIAKATALGADVVMPRSAVKGMGWFAVAIDPEGNPVGFWQDDKNAG